MGDNMEIFLLVILLIVIIFFIVSIIVVYNKLSKYRNNLHNSFNKIKSILNDKVVCVNSYMKNKKLDQEKNVKNIIKNFNTLSKREEIIDASLLLDRELNKLFEYYGKNNISYKKFKEELDKINGEFIEIKKEYNDNVLRFNNLLKMFPISLISSLFGFSEWHYYRND